MTFTELAQPLRGIIPPIVTPLAAQDQLDEPGLERLLDHLVAGGVHGLFVLGSTGEGPSLSYRLRRELIVRTCAQVDGRLPVLVGITDTSLAESIDLACHAAEAGADAVVFAAPYYFPVSQADLLAFSRQLIGQSPLPVVLYNMPALTKVSFEPDTVQRLLDEPKVVGLKDSSGNMDYFKQVREVTRDCTDWTLLVGAEELLAESVALGGHGGVAGGANVWPQLLVSIYDAALEDQSQKLAALEADRVELQKLYKIRKSGVSAVICGIKAALGAMGICQSVTALPFQPFSPEEQAQAESIVRELGLTSARNKDAAGVSAKRL